MVLEDALTQDEINALVIAPARIFNLIAKSDDKIDKKEIQSFENFISKFKKLDSILAQECFGRISSISSIEELRQLSAIGDRENLRYISAFLDRKIDHEIAVDFKVTLVAFGYYIAYASGGIFSHKVSDDESEVLNKICKDLDLSLRTLLDAHQIQKILNKINE